MIIVNRKLLMRNKFFQIVGILVGLILVVKITGDLLHLFKAWQQIEKMERKVAALEKKKKELSEKNQYYQTPEFIEEEARNKLNMAKPGEIIVVLPPNLSEFLNHSKNQNEELEPNWRRWWNLFF